MLLRVRLFGPIQINGEEEWTKCQVAPIAIPHLTFRDEGNQRQVKYFRYCKCIKIFALNNIINTIPVFSSGE